jgi:membrane-associated phospholipid phosphatase
MPEPRVARGTDAPIPVLPAGPLPGVRRRGPRRRGAIAACLACFGVLCLAVRRDRTRAVDLALTLRLQARRSRPLGAVMRAVSWPGFPPQSRVLPAIAIAAWLAAGRSRSAAYLAAAWASGPLSSLVKTSVNRERPLAPQVRVVLAPLGGSSFPSGHVLTYTVTYGFLAYLLDRHVEEPALRRASTWALVALIALVGPSRIQQGHHWPTDVTASYLLGAAYLIALVARYEADDTAGRRLRVVRPVSIRRRAAGVAA